MAVYRSTNGPRHARDYQPPNRSARHPHHVCDICGRGYPCDEHSPRGTVPVDPGYFSAAGWLFAGAALLVVAVVFGVVLIGVLA